MKFKNLFRNPTELPRRLDPIPLKAFYGRREEVEEKRRLFYRQMAKAFEWDGWIMKAPKVAPLKRTKAGRGGSEAKIQKSKDKHNKTETNVRESVAVFVQIGNLLDDPFVAWATKDTRARASLYGTIRRETALKILQEFDTVYGSQLASPDWKKEGRGSPAGLLPAEAKLSAAGEMEDYRRRMPRDLLHLLDRAIIQDEYFWEVDDEDKQKSLLEDFRMALDFAAFVRGHGQHLMEDTLVARWGATDRMPAFKGAVIRARSRRPS